MKFNDAAYYDCNTIIDHILPYLMLISLILGYLLLNKFKNESNAYNFKKVSKRNEVRYLDSSRNFDDDKMN